MLQAREIRRIGFSAVYSYPLRVSTEIRKALASATESKAERTALLCEVHSNKFLFQKYSKFPVQIKSIKTYVLNHINSVAKQNEASSSFELASAVYGSSVFYFRKRNANRVYKSC